MNINIFCDKFHEYYNLRIDYNILSSKEIHIFDELAIVIGRYSPYDDDHKIKNAFFTKEEVNKAVILAMHKLGL